MNFTKQDIDNFRWFFGAITKKLDKAHERAGKAEGCKVLVMPIHALYRNLMEELNKENPDTDEVKYRINMIRVEMAMNEAIERMKKWSEAAKRMDDKKQTFPLGGIFHPN